MAGGTLRWLRQMTLSFPPPPPRSHPLVFVQEQTSQRKAQYKIDPSPFPTDSITNWRERITCDKVQSGRLLLGLLLGLELGPLLLVHGDDALAGLVLDLVFEVWAVVEEVEEHLEPGEKGGKDEGCRQD